MWRNLIILFLLSGCTGLAWNTTLADEPVVRRAMLDSIRPGITTESQFVMRWGRPTQKVREGGETRYIYRSMTNPPGYKFPQFGNSQDYVVVVFQYGRVVSAYSSDTEGCRATFAPRPPGQAYDNPTTVHPVNCGTSGSAVGGPLDATAGAIERDDYGRGRGTGTGSGTDSNASATNGGGSSGGAGGSSSGPGKL